MRSRDFKSTLTVGGAEDIRNLYYRQQEEAIVGLNLKFGRSGTYPDPEKGWKLNFILENAEHFLGGQNYFWRMSPELTRYFSIDSKQKLAARIKLGLGYPADKGLFQLGGEKGLRGYGYKTIIGSQAAMFNLEHRFDMMENLNLRFGDNLISLKKIQGVAFFDIGKSWLRSFHDKDFKKDVGLLQYGYSKEKRGDLKQLIIGILMTKDGLPVACEIFPGNTSDLKSFLYIIEKLKEEYRIGKLIWVADRGMASTDNISKLNELKQEYILGVKMRQFDKEKKDRFLSLDGMFPVRDDLYVKEITVPKEGRYIVCFNPKEAELERKKRDFFRQVLEKKIEKSTTKEWIIKNGYRKYIDIAKGEIELNYKRLRAEGQFDGKWVLLTNSKLDSKQVALAYKDLWQIEASFRDLKDGLEASPIYHWTEKRIIAHIFVSFLSLLLKITFNKKLKQIDKDCSYQEVFDAAREIKAVKLTEGRKEIIFRTEFPDKAHLAFKAIGVAPPDRILSYQESKSVVSRQG